MFYARSGMVSLIKRFIVARVLESKFSRAMTFGIGIIIDHDIVFAFTVKKVNAS